jgi:hypothetical protein
MLENEKKRIAENNSSKKAQVGESDLSGLTMNERIERVRARRKELTREMPVPVRIERIRSQLGLTGTVCPL